MWCGSLKPRRCTLAGVLSACLAGTSLLASVRPAAAQEISVGPMPCADPGAFAELVGQHRSPLGASVQRDRRFTVSVSRDPATLRYLGKVQQWQGNRLLAQREVTGQVCASVADALMLIVAVALYKPERALVRQPAPPRPQPQPSPKGPATAPGAPEVELRFGAQVGARTGSEPAVGGGPTVTLSRDRNVTWFPALSLGAERYFSQTVKAPGSELDLTTTGAWVGVVPYAIRLSPDFSLGVMLRYEAGKVRAQGRGTETPSVATGFWHSGGVEIPLTYGAGDWAWDLGVGLGVPLKKHRFFIRDEGELRAVHDLAGPRYSIKVSVSYRLF